METKKICKTATSSSRHHERVPLDMISLLILGAQDHVAEQNQHVNFNHVATEAVNYKALRKKINE